MTVFGAIFARGGSKGVPGKNLRVLGGISLVGRAVQLGVAMQSIDRVLCSTDSSQIAKEAERCGAEVPFLRPNALAEDHSPEWEAWQHLVNFLLSTGATNSDLLVSLPATSPLRAPEDVNNALAVFKSNHFDLVLGVSESSRSPWLNMVTRDSSGGVRVAFEGAQGGVYRRQDSPEIFDITTVVYVTTLGFISRSRTMFGGSVGSVIIPVERALDIDTELDLKIAGFLLKNESNQPDD